MGSFKCVCLFYSGIYIVGTKATAVRDTLFDGTICQLNKSLNYILKKLYNAKVCDSPKRHNLGTSLFKFVQQVFKKLPGNKWNDVSKKFQISRERKCVT